MRFNAIKTQASCRTPVASSAKTQNDPAGQAGGAPVRSMRLPLCGERPSGTGKGPARAGAVPVAVPPFPKAPLSSMSATTTERKWHSPPRFGLLKILPIVMAEISPVFTHDIGPCLDRRQRLDIRMPVEVPRVHNSLACRIAENRGRIAGPAGAIENAVPCRDQASVGPEFQQSVAEDRYDETAACFGEAVERMRRIQAGFANSSTISQSGSIPKIAGGTFNLDVRLPPPRMM